MNIETFAFKAKVNKGEGNGSNSKASGAAASPLKGKEKGFSCLLSVENLF